MTLPSTVIYTNSLRPTAAVVRSGVMNFIGVIAGGIAVAYALIELLPPGLRQGAASRILLAWVLTIGILASLFYVLER
jgi:phosphate/sulfate permease